MHLPWGEDSHGWCCHLDAAPHFISLVFLHTKYNEGFSGITYGYAVGEDWIWQTPQASPQITAIVMKMFQAGLRKYDNDTTTPQPPILMFVMPMFPGQTPREWRKQLYSDLAYGLKIVNIWPLADIVDNGPGGCYMDPTPVVKGNEYAGMFKSVRRGFHELGKCQADSYEGLHSCNGY